MTTRNRRGGRLRNLDNVLEEELSYIESGTRRGIVRRVWVSMRPQTTPHREGQLIQDKTANRHFEGITHGLFYMLPGTDALVSDEAIDSWFDGIEDDAAEAGYLVPSSDVIEEARRIVRGLRRYLPINADVYVLDGGRVAIEVFGATGYGFLLVCEPSRGALCLITAEGASRRARYENSDILPDEFVRRGLYDVCSGTTASSKLGFVGLDLL